MKKKIIEHFDLQLVFDALDMLARETRADYDGRAITREECEEKEQEIKTLRDKLNHDDGAFQITSVHRDDLEGRGYDTSKVDDATMEQLASKMSDAYTGNDVFWIDLDIIADHLEIPKQK